jgi:hypothetical protein
MEINWSIVGWIIGLVFVYIFGLFEGRGQGYKRRKAEEEKEGKDAPPVFPSTTPATIKTDDPGLLRIKSENGDMTLDLDGARLDPSTLSGDQRKRLIELLTLIRPWLEGKPAAAPSMTAGPGPAAPKTAPVQPAVPAPPATPPPSQPAAAKSSALPKEDRPSAPANSIVGQIDSILQARIAGTPIEERGVFLTQSPEGGVVVYIGLSKYIGVDEVPDEEIKAAIRAAIAEWEKKYTPGL